MTQVNQSRLYDLDERETIEQVLAELHDSDPVPPIGKTLLAINRKKRRFQRNSDSSSNPLSATLKHHLMNPMTG